MKIIKHGKIPTQVICNNCECEFIYDENDIQSDDEWTPEGAGEEIDVYDCKNIFSELKFKTVLAVGWRYYRESYIQCPECGNVILINNSYAFSDNTVIFITNKPIDINNPKIYDNIRFISHSRLACTKVIANVLCVMTDKKIHKLPIYVYNLTDKEVYNITNTNE